MNASFSIRRFVRLSVASALAAGVILALPSARRVAAQGQSSPAARQAEQAAWDEHAPGPKQPIPFSHAIHAGTYQMNCLYCHTESDRSQAAGVPSVELCMGCHLHFGADLEGVQLLERYWEEKKPIPWVRIHRLPEHVQFKHNRHVAVGIECQSCHGPVQQMDKLYLVPDTKWWPWTTPTKKLEMGWCVQCHRANDASQDCVLCHY